MAKAYLDAHDELVATLPANAPSDRTLAVAEQLYELFKAVPGVDRSKVQTPISENNADDVLNEMYNEVKPRLGGRRRKTRRSKRKSKKTRKSRR